MIRIEHLKKEYPNVTPLRDVSVEIRDGDVIAVIGPSGTGKSTLLLINLLEKPTSGRTLGGRGRDHRPPLRHQKSPVSEWEWFSSPLISSDT